MDPSRSYWALQRTAAGLALAVLGVVVFLLFTHTPPDELWWGAPAAALAPHLLAVALTSTGRPRAIAVLLTCAVPALLVSLLMIFATGFGLYQLPAVGLLLSTALTLRDRSTLGAV